MTVEELLQCIYSGLDFGDITKDSIVRVHNENFEITTNANFSDVATKGFLDINFKEGY